jgi:hypothetical protein
MEDMRSIYKILDENPEVNRPTNQLSRLVYLAPTCLKTIRNIQMQEVFEDRNMPPLQLASLPQNEKATLMTLNLNVIPDDGQK